MWYNQLLLNFDCICRRQKEYDEYKRQVAEEKFEKAFQEGIDNAKLVMRKHPIGSDRNHHRYWRFSSVVPGLFVEKGWACKDLDYTVRLDDDEDDDEEEEEGMEVDDENEEGEKKTIWKEKT